MDVQCPIQQYFSYIVAVSLSGRGHQSTCKRNPQTFGLKKMNNWLAITKHMYQFWTPQTLPPKKIR